MAYIYTVGYKSFKINTAIQKKYENLIERRKVKKVALIAITRKLV